jgi:hypothetical protein
LHTHLEIASHLFASRRDVGPALEQYSKQKVIRGGKVHHSVLLLTPLPPASSPFLFLFYWTLSPLP